MSFLKIGGKTAAGTAKGVAVADTGDIVTQKNWNTEITTLYTKTDNFSSGMVDITEMDISMYAAVSLRIYNSTEQGYTLTFYKEGTNVQLRDFSGNRISYEIPYSNAWMIITPNDIDCLQWLNGLHLRYQLNAAAETGTFTIQVVGKR